MKRFLLKAFSAALILALVLASVCIAVDPFNVFHTANIRNNGVEPNKNFIKMKYVLANPEKFDAFMFGSSHVGNIHTDRIPGVRCYNMTCSSGLPDEFLENIRTMVANGIVPKCIYLGLDNLSFSATSDYFHDDPYRCPYEYSVTDPVAFWSMYLTPSTIGAAVLEVMAEHEKSDDFFANFYSWGWNYDYGFRSYSDPLNRSPEELKRMLTGTVEASQQKMPYENTVETIAEIKNLCDENGIELTVFVTPFFYTQTADENYIGFLRSLAEITCYYNFAGYNDLAFDQSNFVDMGHYNAETGDMIVDCMFRGMKYDDLYDQGFGVYVTSDNVNEVIDIIINGKNV